LTYSAAEVPACLRVLLGYCSLSHHYASPLSDELEMMTGLRKVVSQTTTPNLTSIKNLNIKALMHQISGVSLCIFFKTTK
jgi:hypothetical protein